MIREFCQSAALAARKFLRNQSGSIVIYTGAFMAVGMGGAALSIDVGRIVLLKTQMQNRADAAALAGAAQLDAQTGAIARAREIMRDSMKAFTTAGADAAELVVLDERFFAPLEDHISRGPETTDDNLARFAMAIMQQRTLSFFYAPALNIMTGKTASSYTFLNASAVAMSDPFICKMQPLMICNPFDNGDGTSSSELANHFGEGVRIKQSGQSGAWQPGNFGLLDLPEGADYGLSGANAVEAALMADDPLGCYSVSTLSTAPGNKTGKVAAGVNVRFGIPVTDPTVTPAPNVINYPRDTVMETDFTMNMGDGAWDLAGYWAAKHPGVALPADLVGATRFQIYLYETGTKYYQSNKRTAVSAERPPDDAKGNWKLVDPVVQNPAAAIIPWNDVTPDDNNVDGRPPPGQTVSVKGYERRVVKVAVADCLTYTFQGNASIPAEGTYIGIFITEQAGDAADGATIYGELMGGIKARTSVEFHGNVRLTE